MIAELKSAHPLVRPLNHGDLDRIMEIELAAYPFPWSRGIFGDCIRAGYDCWGLQLGRQLVGYSVQNDAAGEAHLLNLCIDPAQQRRGFGSLLLDNALRIARSRGCSSMFLEVRPTNAPGIALYRSRGFIEVGRRPAYYSAETPRHGEYSAASAAAGREDALVMRLELGSA